MGSTPVGGSEKSFSQYFDLSTPLRYLMIGKMAIAAALPGFNDLGRSVTPTFLSRNRFYSQLSPHCPKMNKKINVGS